MIGRPVAEPARESTDPPVLAVDDLVVEIPTSGATARPVDGVSHRLARRDLEANPVLTIGRQIVDVLRAHDTALTRAAAGAVWSAGFGRAGIYCPSLGSSSSLAPSADCRSDMRI